MSSCISLSLIHLTPAFEMAYNGCEYPYLSENDIKEYQDTPEHFKVLNAIRKRDLHNKIAKFSLSENKLNDGIPQANARNELRLVIIGKTGQGKSATANTILGKIKFEEDFTATSVTRKSSCVTELVDERKISVMDTPGLQDTHQSDENILKEIARMTTIFPDGVHAFLYVMNMANPRFTAEDKNVLDLIEKSFGGGFKNYCLLVFSHGDSELKDIDLDTYREKQMANGHATNEQLTPQNIRRYQEGPDQDHYQDQDEKNLKILLYELSWKMLAIDNKTSIPLEKTHYRKNILAMVDRMRTLNNPEIYTNEMFVKAQQEREDMRHEGLRKGWDPSLTSKVETILAGNPNISREELQVEVRRQLQEESQNKWKELQRREEEFNKRRIAEEKRLHEQKRVDEEKRQAEEKDRRKRQKEEDLERKERFQNEELERQERREREYRQWQFRQKQQEIELQKRFQTEDMERQRRFAEEQETHAQRIQLQKDEWEKRKEEIETRQKRQQEMWAKQFKEDQERKYKQEEDKFRIRELDESKRKIQQEIQEEQRREQNRRVEMDLVNLLAKIRKDEFEKQMKMKEEDQKRRDMQEEERKQFQLLQTQETEQILIKRKEEARLRKEEHDRDELERQKRRQQEDIDRERKWKMKQEERDKAEKERSKKTEEEIQNLRQIVKNMDDRLTGRRVEGQVTSVQRRREHIFSRVFSYMTGNLSQDK